MEIERTTFGSITIDGKTYEHDVIIRLSGEAAMRKKSCRRSTTAPRMSSRRTKRSSSLRRAASSWFLARARWASCIYRRKLRPILRKRVARSCCSRLPSRFVLSTTRMLRRSAFFTLHAESGRPRLRCGGWRNEIGSEALTVLSQPMPTLAGKNLVRLHRKAHKRGAHFRQLNISAQHDLRIDLKKLRYAAEFFLPLYAAHAPAKRYVRRLARLQAAMGRARDIASTWTLLDAIRHDDQPALHLAIGAVAGWQARDQMAVAKTLRKRWRRFKGTPTF
jgi:hypothetical protein